MPNRQIRYDGVPPGPPIIPLVKRKRHNACLGEQERRERKRAIDREAQRSLREKTKSHIAELERTIQVLRDQDRNAATSGLLSEIEGLRAENERLREVIDNVKNVIGVDLLPPTTAASAAAVQDGPSSPAGMSVGQPSPQLQTASYTNETTKSFQPTPLDHPTPFECAPTSAAPLDLDGLTVMANVDVHGAPDPRLGLNVELGPVADSSGEEEVEELPWGKDPATATWAPMMEEIFGPNWRCPSPVILHIGNPELPSSSTADAMCPVWKKSNELFGKVVNFRSGTGFSSVLRSDAAEAGLLFLGINQGWNSLSNEWMQSPALMILKQVDELLFYHLPKIERLATAYKSFKLLKYYLNTTDEVLEKMPLWLRPSIAQSSTAHPIALDFFAWPTVRDRLVHAHGQYFRTGDLSCCYPRYLQFDWPFALEDTFFLDPNTNSFVPSPLFEHFHADLRYWNVDPLFFEKFPEIRKDIEGDQKRFCEVVMN